MKQPETGGDLFDVVIVGGGITGLTTAYELQQAGQRCLVAEAHTLCFGTTGGTTAHLNNFFDKSYQEVLSDFGETAARNLAAAAKDALALYKKNITTLKIDCNYSEGDGVLFSTNEKQSDELREIFQAAMDVGIAVRYATESPVPVPFEKAISFPFQGQIHPAKYVYALASAFESAGGVIRCSCIVQDVKEKDLLEIQTSLGPIRAKKLVYATHIPPGVNVLHLRCAPYRSYAMAIELEDDSYPASPAYDMMDPYHYYRTQEVEGKKYLIAGGEDHKTGHEDDTNKPFEKLESYLRQFFPIREIKFRWSSQYFEPADGLAYIGHLPGASKNIMVATGFSGNGMTFSHIAARVLTGLITRDEPSYEGLFDPGRIKPIAGFAALVKENVDVVSSFIGDRLNISSLDSLTELPADSAKVVKYEKHSIAVYRDEQGALFAVNPTCTHLKCTVKWNQTEKSWDCPCHGARYAVNGTILTGPSTRPLPAVEI